MVSMPPFAIVISTSVASLFRAFTLVCCELALEVFQSHYVYDTFGVLCGIGCVTCDGIHMELGGCGDAGSKLRTFLTSLSQAADNRPSIHLFDLL